jgi:hypothetical protein
MRVMQSPVRIARETTLNNNVGRESTTQNSVVHWRDANRAASRRAFAIILGVVVILSTASAAAAADPTGTVAPEGSAVAIGQPANDRQLSVLSAIGKEIAAAKLDGAARV